MNKEIMDLAKTAESKIKTLGKKESGIYKGGLLLLGSIVSEGFLDLPLLPEIRHSENGLFYSIPYIHDETLYAGGNSRMLLVISEVKDGTYSCPFRIDIKYTDVDDYSIVVYDQSENGTKSYKLIQKESGQHYTEIPNYDSLTLSELMKAISTN